MIKYNTKTINDWNFDATNIVKVYHNGAVCYYKLEGSPTPTGQTPCYAVVDDITQYSPTEFVDVFDKATKKWYKLNNLNQFEEYGLYGEGRDITYYEGKLTVDGGYEYEYSNGDWVNRGEVSGTTATLPNVPFTVNYNAKNYDASTSTFAKTEGQLANTDVTVSGTLTAHDGYVTVSRGSRGIISGYDDYFNRTNSTPNLTIISKQRTEGQNCHMFANRSSNYNWMYRPYSSELTLHGTYEQGGLTVTTQPVIESVRVYSDRSVTYNNYTDNTSSTASDFNYGSTNGSVALFAGYTNGDTEWFVGDFYWIYMSQSTLTDEQVQEVINYNEVVSISEYPIYYAERQSPPKELVFDTMEEALAYQCPYVGVMATIGGTLYVFNSDYQWERLAFNITGVTTSSNVFDIQLNMEKKSVAIYKDNGDGTYNWGLHYPNPITDATNMCSGNTAMTSFDWGTADTSSLTGLSSSFRNCSGLTSMPSIPSNVTEIGDYTFHNCKNMNNGGTIEIPEGVERIGKQAFYRVFTNSKNLKLPSTLNYVGLNAFANCYSLSDLYINDLSSFCKIEFNNSYSAVFNGSSTYLYVNNTQVTDLTIPTDITELKAYTFYNALTITSVTIPSTVTSINGNGTFQNNGLINVTVPSSVTSWNGSDTFSSCASLTDATLNNSGAIGEFAFLGCISLTSVTFGNNITEIKSGAFENCESLTDITFGDNITSIGGYAFNNCTKLASVTLNSTTPPTINSNSLQGIPSTCKFYVPCSAVNTYRTASVWSSYASQIVGYESCTVYDWVVAPNEYICYSHDKYEKVKKIRSFDGGTTWEDVYPIEYQRGQLIEASSTDCVSASIAVNLNSQWQTSTSYGSISDTENYDFYESYSNLYVDNGKATMFITINGYTSFTFKVRNNSESSYDYVVVNNLDDTTIPKWRPSVGNGTASGGYVYYSNKGKSSSVTWYDVTFDNLDGGEHYITITYGKDSSGDSNDDRGYVAIPKTQ